MRVLAIETATLTGAVAVLDGDRVVGEITLSVALTHSERLLAAIDRLLADCGWTLAGLQGLAVSIGPGSFTGLRVGLATVQGLAFATGLPVAAVPTLDALAEALPFADGPVCPVLDARKGEVYVSLYRWAGERMERLWDYQALSPAEVVRRLPGGAILVGDGAESCRAALGGDPHPLRIAPPPRRLPSAGLVGWLGQGRLAAGTTVAADGLRPLYLRPSEAELKAQGAGRRG
jgi:tRNA threonylcarbamoyladenosine biosynthesis protein TsaB